MGHRARAAHGGRSRPRRSGSTTSSVPRPRPTSSVVTTLPTSCRPGRTRRRCARATSTARRCARSGSGSGCSRAASGFVAVAGWRGRRARPNEVGPTSVVHGYLLVPAALGDHAAGNFETASAAFGEAARVAGLHGDADLADDRPAWAGGRADRTRPGLAWRGDARRGDGGGDGRRGVRRSSWASSIAR